MKKIFILFLALSHCLTSTAQSVGVGTTTPHSSAALDITSTNKGVLVPRMTTSQRTAISGAANGLLVFDTDAGSFYFFNNGTWTSLTDGGSSNSLWTLNGNNINNTNTGNVMIGPGTPSSRFTVSADNTGITQQTTNGLIKVGFYTDPNNGAFVQTHSNHPLKLTAGNLGARITILPSGNVGIGTTSPTQMFHVTGGNSLFGGPVELTNGLKISSGSPGLGKMLVSDAEGNVSWKAPLNDAKVGFHIRGIVAGGAGVLAPQVYNKVHFATKATDYGADYLMIDGTPSSSFITPVNGFYHFDVNLNLRDFATTDPTGIPENAYTVIEARILLKRDNSTITLLSKKSRPSPNTNELDAIPISLSTDVRLLAGDILWVELYHMNLQNKNGILYQDPDFCSFSGHLIYQD